MWSHSEHTYDQTTPSTPAQHEDNSRQRTNQPASGQRDAICVNGHQDTQRLTYMHA